jgi:hypothetical protein
MPASPDFRSWATPGGQSGRQRTTDREVRRLMSIAVYWERLAALEDWERGGVPASEANHP